MLLHRFPCTLQGTGQYKMTDGLALNIGRTRYKALRLAFHTEVDPLPFILSYCIHSRVPLNISSIHWGNVRQNGAFVNTKPFVPAIQIMVAD